MRIAKNVPNSLRVRRSKLARGKRVQNIRGIIRIRLGSERAPPARGIQICALQRQALDASRISQLCVHVGCAHASHGHQVSHGSCGFCGICKVGSPSQGHTLHARCALRTRTPGNKSHHLLLRDGNVSQNVAAPPCSRRRQTSWRDAGGTRRDYMPGRANLALLAPGVINDRSYTLKNTLRP